MACGGTPSALLGRPFCKGSHRLFPLSAAPVIRRVVSPADTALRLFPRGSATAREVGTTTGDTPGSVTAAKLLVSEALTVFSLQWAFGATYDSTETRKPQISVSARNFDISGQRANDNMNWPVGGRYLEGPGRGDRGAPA